MEDKNNNVLDTLVTTVYYGFVVLGLFMIADAVFTRKSERKYLPEHIVTSRGRLLFLEMKPDNTYEFNTADAGETRCADEIS